MCRRRVLSVLSALVLMLVLALSSVASAADPLFYARWYRNDGSVGEYVGENDEGRWIGDLGDNWYVQLYTDAAAACRMPDTAAVSFVPDSGTSADAVEVTYRGGGEWSIAYRGMGSGVLRTVVDGVEYERPVLSRMPDCAFTTQPQLEQSTLFQGHEFHYTQTDRTFYFVLNRNDMTITDVQFFGGLGGALEYSLNADKTMVTFTVKAGMDQDYGGDIHIAMEDRNGGIRGMGRGIQLVNGAPVVVLRHVNGDPNDLREDQQSMQRGRVSIAPADSYLGVFCLRENGVITPLRNITSVVSADAAVAEVFPLGTTDQGNTAYRFHGVNFGNTEVTVTYDGGKTLTVPVNVVLPNRGFSTEQTLTQSSLMTGYEFCYTQTDRTFYFVLNRNDMTITDVRLTGGLDGALDYTLDADKRVVTFAVKSGVVLDYGGDIHITMQDQYGNTDNMGRSFRLANGAPVMVYRRVNGNWDDLVEDMNESVRADIGLNPGYSHWMVFCLRENGVITPLQNITSVVSSAPSVAAVTSLGQTTQGNPAYEIHGLDFGSAAITVTYDGGKTMTMPVNVVLPGRGWSAGTAMTPQSYVAGEFTYTQAAPTVYYVAEGIALTSFGVTRYSAQYADCFDIQIVVTASGSYAAVTVKPGASLPGEERIRFEGVGTAVAGYGSGTWSVGGDIRFINGDAIQLGTPSELEWNVWHHSDSNKTTRMGCVGFKRAASDQARYQIEYWRVGEQMPVFETEHRWNSTHESQYLNISAFIFDDVELPSGEYYFRLRALGDGCNYRSGDWVESGRWVYTKPAAQLPAPTGLKWDDSNDGFLMKWDPAAGAESYKVYAYYSETLTGKKIRVGDVWDIDETGWWLWDNSIAQFGDGWYFFRVRAYPSDMTQSSKSGWSAYSPAYHMGVDASVSSALGSISAAGSTVAAVAQTVGGISKLDKALAADTTNSGTVAAIAKLEKDLGLSTAVDTKSAPAGIAAGDVKVTGAALNLDGAATTATLTISAVDPANPPAALIPEQYKNTVQFAMDIPEARDTDPSAAGLQLAVPVKITLPIPSGVNPAFLVVLHYKESTKEWEELSWPHVYQDNYGKWFATFVVDSMSPFAIVERQSGAEVRDGKIVVDAYLPTTGAQVEYLCAVYSAEGKMLELVTLQPHSEEPVEIEVSELGEGMYLKVISANVGGGWVPVSGAQRISVAPQGA